MRIPLVRYYTASVAAAHVHSGAFHPSHVLWQAGLDQERFREYGVPSCRPFLFCFPPHRIFFGGVFHDGGSADLQTSPPPASKRESVGHAIESRRLFHAIFWIPLSYI